MTVKKIEDRFIRAQEVADILGISRTSAYKVVKSLNNELEAMGKIIVRGKISRRYFEEKFYA